MCDGNIVYQGLAQDSAAYFGIGKGSYLNPADYFMKELSVNYPKKQADFEKIKKLVDKYQNGPAERVVKEERVYKMKSLAPNGKDSTAF